MRSNVIVIIKFFFSLSPCLLLILAQCAVFFLIHGIFSCFASSVHRNIKYALITQIIRQPHDIQKNIHSICDDIFTSNRLDIDYNRPYLLTNINVHLSECFVYFHQAQESADMDSFFLYILFGFSIVSTRCFLAACCIIWNQMS